MKRFVAAMLVALLCADVAMAVGLIGPEAREAEAIVAVVPTTTTSTSTTTTTTTTAPPPVAPPKPVSPPRRPYAAEPIVVIGSIEIPKLGLKAPLGEGISLRNIDRGPSHWPGTAMPGRVGNVVVAGHRVTHTHPFRYIDQLVPGDEVFFEYQGARYRYVVTGSEVVTPQQTEIVKQTYEPTATLFACHPPGSARYRYVVHLALAK
jgi:sortase A